MASVHKMFIYEILTKTGNFEGNYMNSSKRGPAYGFKLQSLDTLMDTKSSDKRMCLMHYLAATIRQKFPELLTFDSELLYIDKAALVSMENLVADIHELEKGMDQVRKEFELRSKSGQSAVLRDFLSNSEDKLRRLQNDIRSAQDSFRECVEYFGESARSTDANTFFALLVRFARAFKVFLLITIFDNFCSDLSILSGNR